MNSVLVPRQIGLVLLGALLMCGLGCTDAATRLAYDIKAGALELRHSSEHDGSIVHQPRQTPEGCASSYEVIMRSAVHGPEPKGLLSVGCVGSANYESLGYDYFTTYHLNAVRVPTELRISKKPGEAITISLRRDGESVDVIGLR